MYTIKNLTKTQLEYIRDTVHAKQVYTRWNSALAELQLVVAHSDGWKDLVTFDDYQHRYEANHIYDGVSDPAVSSNTIIGAIKRTETPDPRE